jgi:twinkle protein
MGKSTLMNGIIAHALMNHFPVCVASFETDVKPILVDGLAMAMMRCDKNELKRIDRSDTRSIMRERLRIISQNVDEDAEMDLDSFLEYCRIAVTRDGCKMIVLDPWNEIEHKRRRDETETDYIGRALRQIKRFARQYDVAFWVVAHPSKPQEGSNKVPGLYDISGSANWANKPEYGLTYHRPKPDENKAIIRVSKVRMGLPGRKGSKEVQFNFQSSEFVELTQ